MMKKIALISLLSCCLFQQAAYAKQPITKDYSPAFVPFDILLFRPLGLATTAVGSALFVILTPLTALSAIAPPHDAFERAADVLVVVPGTYTFLRPVGKFLCPGNCRPASIQTSSDI